VVICLERGADLHMAQLMPLPLTVSCFSKIQIGFTFLVPAHPGSPGKGPLSGCVCGLNRSTQLHDALLATPHISVTKLIGCSLQFANWSLVHLKSSQIESDLYRDR